MTAKTTRGDVLVLAFMIYAFGIWLHIPFGGGHIYSDIVSVFGTQLLKPNFSATNIPYVNTFVEYPVLVSLFIYAMGLIGSVLPFSTLNGYYFASVAFLAIPSLLLVDETMKVGRLVGASERRVLLYIVLTPTFLFLLLESWYMVGVYFSMLGLRMFLEGRRTLSGVLFGISAASNLVTAAPAIGLFFSLRSLRGGLVFAGSAGLTFLVLNTPFVLINPQLWISYWQFQSNWYIEGSWMLAFLNNESPLRHVIFPALAVVLLGAILVLSRTKRTRDPLTLAWLSTFALLFSSYVFTPQMNLILLPFFALVPIAKRYWEFLAFDILTAAILVIGFSQPLQAVGITYNVDQFSYYSPVQWAEIIRSLWLGKFLFWDGLGKVIRGRVVVDGTLSGSVMKLDNWLRARLFGRVRRIPKSIGRQ
ncbi:MAG: hypothetical protein OK456_10210 [Thaumarchaeota archaeon]|nr:hypothetical protein [Nitrososphaerota archaeon]